LLRGLAGLACFLMLPLRLPAPACARVALVAAMLTLGAPPFSAHDDVAVRIAALSAQLSTGRTADLLVRRAELYRQAGKRTEALADLLAAEQLDASHPAVDLVRAHVHFDAGRWTDATNAATSVLARAPSDSDALILRARAAVRLGDRSRALDDYSAALRAQPNPDVYIERARAYDASSARGRQQALASLDEGIARLGPIVTLQLEAIHIEVALGRFDAALTRVDLLRAQASRHDAWLARRGAILEKAGRLEEARAAYAEALDALKRLPDRTRSTRASIELAARLHADIRRVSSNMTTAARPRSSGTH
jgi:tetratricopeptide (TPR) repeat protein